VVLYVFVILTRHITIRTFRLHFRFLSYWIARIYTPTPCSLYLDPLPSLEIVPHKNVRLSDVIASAILESHHLPIGFHVLDLVKVRDYLTRAEN